jgi:hypothetical protein
LIASADRAARIVVDAGPLIAFFQLRDPEHVTAVRGIAQLREQRTRIDAPLPIVFEVYKWLVNRAGPGRARENLEIMRQTLAVSYPGPNDLEDLARLTASMPTWSGSLEDGLVALVGLRADIPVWTFNYRDLAAFRNLRFWNPA